MKEKDIRSYAQVMHEMGLTALEIKDGDKSLRLEMNATAASGAVPAPPVQQAAVPKQEKPDHPRDMENICSPMVGVFYSAPAENADPFVQIGDKVKKGDVLCIIEAMKLMNEITAEWDGTIMDVCVGNNQVVDFGHVLFRIRKDAK